MNLYEIRTGRMGESYERAYAWAADDTEAVRLFKEKNPLISAWRLDLKLLLEGRHVEGFSTQVSDEGWEM